MKNLYIDFDGVILDTITPLYDALEAANLKEASQEDITLFLAGYPWKIIISDDLIINDSINAIKKIIDSKKFNISILTHVNSLQEAIAKINYLRKYFQDITIIPCPKIISKTKMVHTENSILIDDYANNLREWEDEGGIGVRFSQKGNGKGFRVISNLEEIIDMF